MQVIIVPCFNEQKRLDLEVWQQVITRFAGTFWIFIDDGSSDQTLSLLLTLKGSNLKILSNDHNLGKGETVRQGFMYARNNLLGSNVTCAGYLDADGAFDISDIGDLFKLASNLLELESHFSSIIGSRVKLAGREIKRDNLRHWIGRVISTFISSGWDSAPYDSQSGFKIFRFDTNFCNSIDLPFKTRWFFDIELLIRLEILGGQGTFEQPLKSWTEIGAGAIRPSSYINILKEIFLAKLVVKKHLKTRRKNGFN